jgi:hypothetical protein
MDLNSLNDYLKKKKGNVKKNKDFADEDIKVKDMDDG